LGHDNSHKKPENNKATLALSYHGDPENNHKFRLIGINNENWARYGDEIIMRTKVKGENINPCLNCEAENK
jgi:hypothetical protein